MQWISESRNIADALTKRNISMFRPRKNAMRTGKHETNIFTIQNELSLLFEAKIFITTDHQEFHPLSSMLYFLSSRSLASSLLFCFHFLFLCWYLVVLFLPLLFCCFTTCCKSITSTILNPSPTPAWISFSLSADWYFWAESYPSFKFASTTIVCYWHSARSSSSFSTSKNTPPDLTVSITHNFILIMIGISRRPEQ